jgi:hypothetical protein
MRLRASLRKRSVQGTDLYLSHQEVFPADFADKHRKMFLICGDQPSLRFTTADSAGEVRGIAKELVPLFLCATLRPLRPCGKK